MAAIVDISFNKEQFPSSLVPSDASHSLSENQKHQRRRRGHFKSRFGCLNCKQRKIKCNEVRPNCLKCCRLGLQCVYVDSPNASFPSKTPPSGLTLDDLRFYHHFLTAALPSLPFEGEDVWWQIAATAHNVCTLSTTPCYSAVAICWPCAASPAASLLIPYTAFSTSI